MTSKYALVIANTEYQDPNFAKLTAPGKDAKEFARVLRDLAGFHVDVLLNEGEGKTSRAIARFFRNRSHDDLLLIYFSGHGVRNDSGQLFLATTDTEPGILDATSISSEFITNAMNNSLSRRQVLVLDCCNSGAFAQGRKSSAVIGESMGIASAFEGRGFGRIVLTATDATQYAWEGNKIIGNTQNSVFTYFLIKGLKGEADRDGDGSINVDELYDYAYEQVRRVTPKQTPGKWSYKQQGEIVLRDNLARRAVSTIPLPFEMLEMLAHSTPGVREEGVKGLIGLLDGKNQGLARSAQEKLREVAVGDDSNRLRKLAKEALIKRGLEVPKNDALSSSSPSLLKKKKTSSRFIPTYMGIGAGVLVLLLVMWGGWKILSTFPVGTPEPTQPIQEMSTQVPQPSQTPSVISTITIEPSPILPTPTADLSRGVKDGMELVLIPAGKFQMGSTGNEPDERPVRTVYLDAFLIDKTEVTNAMYALCVRSGRCDAPRSNTSISQNAQNDSFYYGNPDFDDFPVIFVSWIDAKAYCNWAGRRLPTEAEWEKAASWDDQQQVKRLYPWGNKIDCSYANYYGDGKTLCVGDTTPVGSYPAGASFYGILDMAGNVWEWVADRYDPEYYGEPDGNNPTGPSSGDYIVIRGGSFLTGRAVGIRSSDREKLSPANTSQHIGFRCAADAP